MAEARAVEQLEHRAHLPHRGALDLEELDVTEAGDDADALREVVVEPRAQLRGVRGGVRVWLPRDAGALRAVGGDGHDGQSSCVQLEGGCEESHGQAQAPVVARTVKQSGQTVSGSKSNFVRGQAA